MLQYVHSTFTESYDTSDDQPVHKQITIDGEPCLVELLFADAKSHTKIELGDAFVLLYAINDRGSFVGTRDLYHLLQQTKAKSTRSQVLGSSSPGPVPVYLVGSKMDLENERQVNLDEAKNLAIELQCRKLFEVTSKKHFAEIDDLFTKLIKELPRPQQQYQQLQPSRPSLASVQESVRPGTTSSQAQRSITSPSTSPRRSSVLDRLKFGSLRRSPSMQSLARKKSESFEENVRGLGPGSRSRDNLRSFSGNSVNVNVNMNTMGSVMANVERPTTPYKLDVDTSAWRETIKWPTEIISEEDLKAK